MTTSVGCRLHAAPIIIRDRREVSITQAPGPYGGGLRWRVVITRCPLRGRGNWAWWRDSARDAYRLASTLARGLGDGNLPAPGGGRSWLTTFALVTQPQGGRARIKKILELPDEPQYELAHQHGERFVHLPMGGEVGQEVEIDEDGVADVVREEENDD